MQNKLCITCLKELATDTFGKPLQAPKMPPEKEMSVIITHEPQLSLPFPTQTHFVMIHAGVACALAIGEEPVADPDFHRVNSGEVRFYGVTAGHKLSVVEAVESLD